MREAPLNYAQAAQVLVRRCRRIGCCRWPAKGSAYCKLHGVGAGKKTKSAPDALILPQRDLARTHVYFMQAGEGAIKIGVSDDVWARMASLQTAQPEELKLIACLYCAPHVERTLHRAFEAYSLRGEWFRPSDEIMHLVSLITAKDAAGALQFIDDRDPLLKRH